MYNDIETAFLVHKIGDPIRQRSRQAAGHRFAYCWPICDICHSLQKEIDSKVNDFTIMNPEQRNRYMESVNNPLPVTEPFTGHNSIYELTLTLPEDKREEIGTLAEGLQKIAESEMTECVGYIACYELTKKGVPHIHAIIYSKKRFLNSSKYKYPYRFELAKVKNEKAYLAYIYKERANQLVKDFCQLNNLLQFSERHYIDAV